MSKQYNIRWGRSDYSKLSHLVRKVNEKIFAIEVKRPEIAGYQPDYLEYADLKAQIKTRADLNRVLNRYKRYLREGAEEIETSSRSAKDTKWAVKEYGIAKRADNAQKARKRKEIEGKEVTVAGKGTGVTRAEMGSIKHNELNPTKKNFKDLSQKEWDIIKGKIDKTIFDSYKEARKNLLRDNYIIALHKLNYPDDIEELVLRLPIDVFIEKHNTDPVCHIDFLYDPIDMSWKVSIVRGAWQRVVNENVFNQNEKGEK